MSIRDRIIAASDTAKELLELPEWGVTVEVRSMSGGARASLVQDASNNDGKLNFTAALPEIIIGCTFDPETGERVFQHSDKEALMEKSGQVLDKIIVVAMRLSGFNDGAVDAAGKGS